MHNNRIFSRTLALAYGLVSYLLFLGVFVYAAGFVGNFLVPKSLDSAPQSHFLGALVTNLGLLGLFALQHSGMARPAFKRWWTQKIPKALERSTYVLFSSLAMILLFIGWQPLGGVVWNFANPPLYWGMIAMCAFGWLLVLASTFLIHHFDLFGLRQVWLHFLGKEYTPLPFRTPSLYRYVRHPLYLGWLCAFWFTPTMTLSHLLFALITTAYILVAVGWEEKDLMQAHPEYAAYREEVPMLFPRMGEHPEGIAV